MYVWQVNYRSDCIGMKCTFISVASHSITNDVKLHQLSMTCVYFFFKILSSESFHSESWKRKLSPKVCPRTPTLWRLGVNMSSCTWPSPPGCDTICCRVKITLAWVPWAKLCFFSTYPAAVKMQVSLWRPLAPTARRHLHLLGCTASQVNLAHTKHCTTRNPIIQATRVEISSVADTTAHSLSFRGINRGAHHKLPKSIPNVIAMDNLS